MPRTRNRRQLSEAERAERRRRDQQRLVEATRSLLDSDGWKAWLRTRATLHGYSLNNTYLIALEARRRGFRPTHVAGFRAWNKLGRVVRKGEPGLPIFAPVTVRKRAETNNNDDDDSEGKRTFFRVVYVWDVSQTKPLPGVQPALLAPPARQPLTGDSHAGLLQPLTGLAEQLGYRVHYRPLEGPDGLCRYSDRSISIELRLAPNAQVATLVHELGHALLHSDPDRPSDPRVEELVVESVTYIALAAAGLDTASDSVPYIAGWQGADSPDALQATAQLIDRLARRIEPAVAPGPPPQQSAEQALALAEAA